MRKVRRLTKNSAPAEQLISDFLLLTTPTYPNGFHYMQAISTKQQAASRGIHSALLNFDAVYGRV